jgi:hypothetical protein
MLAFQRIWSRLIWSSKTPDIGKYLRRGQAVTSPGRFDQLTKQGNLVALGVESDSFHSRNVWCHVLGFKW